MRKIIFGLMFTLIVLTSISAICAADDAAMENANIISDYVELSNDDAVMENANMINDDVELNNDDVGGGAIFQDGNGILNKDVNTSDDLSGGAVWEESDDNNCQSEANDTAKKDINGELSINSISNDSNDVKSKDSPVDKYFNKKSTFEMIDYKVDKDNITFKLLLKDKKTNKGISRGRVFLSIESYNDHKRSMDKVIGMTDENGYMTLSLPAKFKFSRFTFIGFSGGDAYLEFTIPEDVDETNADDDCSDQCYLELISYDFVSYDYGGEGIVTFELILKDSNGQGIPNEIVVISFEDLQIDGDIGITDENGHVVIVTAYDIFDTQFVFATMDYSVKFIFEVPKEGDIKVIV